MIEDGPCRDGECVWLRVWLLYMVVVVLVMMRRRRRPALPEELAP